MEYIIEFQTKDDILRDDNINILKFKSFYTATLIYNLLYKRIQTRYIYKNW